MEEVKKIELPGYAKVAGILSLVLAIVSFLIPIFGTLYVAPVAAILGVVAMYGGYKNIALATLIVIAVKLLISPTFWINFKVDNLLNNLLSYICVAGIGLMIYYYTKK